MIYNVSGTSQNRLSARVSIQRRQRRQFTLAQRRHIVTLVDRAVQENVMHFFRAVENLPEGLPSWTKMHSNHSQGIVPERYEQMGMCHVVLECDDLHIQRVLCCEYEVLGK
jgi:hypothetical protein